MRPIKHILIGAVIALVVSFFAFNTTSCTKDLCGTVVCHDSGRCYQGVCDCRYPGVGGPTCEYVYRDMFSGTYEGTAPLDTVAIDSTHALLFVAGDDMENKENMNVYWLDVARAQLRKFSIRIYGYTPTGTNFKLTDSNWVDTFTYSGTGTVNFNNASLRLVCKRPNGTDVFNFNNYQKKP